MQEETVVYKLDVSNERIKRKAMEVVWKFSSITCVDIKEKGRLKVRGKFDKSNMGLKLNKIDKSVDIIDSTGNGEQNYNPSNVQNMQEVIFKVYKVRKANTVIWKFPGVISVEVKRYDQLEVKGEFNSLEMVKKLKKIDKYVEILKVGEYVEVPPPHAGNMFAGGPKAPERSNSMPVPQPQVNQQPPQFNQHDQGGGRFGFFGLNKQQPQVNQPAHRRGAWNNEEPPMMQQQPQFNQHDHQGGGMFGFLGLNKQQPQVNHRRQDWAQIQKEKRDKKRIEKERAEKERADKKLRMDRAKAEKLRAEKAEAERRRINQENADKLRISTSRTGGQNTLMQTLGFGGESSWFTGSSSTANPSSSQLTGASRTTLPSSTANPSSSQLTGASRTTLPSSTANASSSQLTRASRTTVPISTTNTSAPRSTRASGSTQNQTSIYRNI